MNGEKAATYSGTGMSHNLTQEVLEPQMPTVGALPWVDQLNYSHQFIYSKQYLARDFKNRSCYPQCMDEEAIIMSGDPTSIYTPPCVIAMLNQQQNEEHMNRRMRDLMDNNENEDLRCNRITPVFSIPEIDPQEGNDCAPFPTNCILNRQPPLDGPMEEACENNGVEQTHDSQLKKTLKEERSSFLGKRSKSSITVHSSKFNASRSKKTAHYESTIQKDE